jgi:hypothetical protein
VGGHVCVQRSSKFRCRLPSRGRSP